MQRLNEYNASGKDNTVVKIMPMGHSYITSMGADADETIVASNSFASMYIKRSDLSIDTCKMNFIVYEKDKDAQLEDMIKSMIAFSALEYNWDEAQNIGSMNKYGLSSGKDVTQLSWEILYSAITPIMNDQDKFNQFVSGTPFQVYSGNYEWSIAYVDRSYGTHKYTYAQLTAKSRND